MNTSTQPIRRSARLAARSHAVVVTVRTTPVSVRSRPSGRSTMTDGTSYPVKTRHSARTALRKRPNYYEPEEWEVEDPIYPSTGRTFSDLSESERTKFFSEANRYKESLNRAADFTLLKSIRHCGVIDTFWVCGRTEIMIPMFPKFRAVVRDKIRELEQALREENCPMDPWLQLSLREAMEETKKVLANAHRSPYYVAAS